MRSLAAAFVVGSVGLASLFSVGCSGAGAQGIDEKAEQDRAATQTATTANGSSASTTPSALSCTMQGRFTTTATVTTDTRTQLAWERLPDPIRRTQDGAALYCSARGWRLPTAPEMTTLRVGPAVAGNDSGCVPSIDQAAFPDTPADGFWTASITPNPDAGLGDPDGLYMDFNDGLTHPEAPSALLLVRCVADVTE
jgi:hypothetical protein